MNSNYNFVREFEITTRFKRTLIERIEQIRRRFFL